MHYQFSPYALITAIAALIALLLAVVAHRHTPAGRQAFRILMVAGAVWAMGDTLALSATELSTKILWTQISYLGVVVVPIAWFSFALAYTGQAAWLTRNRLLVLLILPTITFLLAITNSLHGLLWRQGTLDLTTVPPALRLEPGMWFWVHACYSYALIAGGTALLIQFARHTHPLYRHQSAALIAGAVLPWIAAAINVVGGRYLPVDPKTLAYPLSGALLIWAMLRLQLLDLIPIARKTSLDGIPDGVIVVDRSYRIIDANTTAGRILGQAPAELLGKPLEQFAPEIIEPLQTVAAKPESDGRYQTEITLGQGASRRTYDLAVSALSTENGADQPSGYLIALHDVTPHKEAERILQDAEARYRALVEQIPAIHYIERLKREDPAVYVSPQVRTILGFEAEEWLNQPGFWSSRLHPDDREEALTRLARTVTTKQPFSAEYRLLRKDGQPVWMRDEGVLVLDEAGEPQFLQGVIVDITEKKRAEEATRFLSEASDLLTASLDHERTLQQLAALTVPRLADWCAIDIVTPQGTLEELTLVHADAARTARFRTARARAGLIGEHPDLCRTVLRQGQTVFLPECSGEMLAQPDADPERQRAFATLDIRSAMFVPLVARGRTLGVFTFVYGKSGRRYDTADLELATELARRAALAIENARLYREAQDAEARLRSLIEQIPAITYEFDETGQILYVSAHVESTLGLTAEECYADPNVWENRLHPADRHRFRTIRQAAIKAGAPFCLVYRLLSVDGRVVWVRDESVVLAGEIGQPIRWQGVMLNITEQKETEHQLHVSEQRYRSLFAQNPDAVFSLDLNGKIVTANAAVERLSGYPLDSLLQRPLTWLVTDDDAQRTAEQFRAVLRGKPQSIEVTIRHRTGRRIDLNITMLPMIVNGEIVGAFGVAKDMTERNALQRQLSHQAFHDVLTNLPNRALFMDRLEQALAKRGRHEGTTAVLFLDVDNFKVINDSLGHQTGDQLLVELANRIQRCLRPGDTAARFGGDEFAILIEDVHAAEEAAKVAERLAATLRQPLTLDGHEMVITSSIGIVLADESHEQAEHLLRDADVALYRAKHQGKARYEIFHPSMNAEAITRLQLESDLRRAVERNEFRLDFQLQINLDTGKIAGVEALVRWAHPERGLMLPSQFIPIAEETALIVPIGREVLRQACRVARRWQERYPTDPPLSVSINLSARQFQDPELVANVAAAIKAAGLRPGSLMVELTESVVMDDTAASVAKLRALKELGVKIAIDDFGTGYSSLAYLKRLPVDYVKIDRSFIDGLGDDPDDTVLVSGIVELTHALGLRVAAEGVETEAQRSMLRDLKCDVAQGYLFAPPLPEARVEALIAAQHGSGLLFQPFAKAEAGKREHAQLSQRGTGSHEELP